MKGKEYLSSISLSYCVFLQCNQTISISHDHNVLTLQRFGTKFADESKEDPTNQNSASVRIISHSPPYLYRPIHLRMLSWNAFILISSFIMISWPSRYEIGGVVSMYPTVLYCSPMKERDEALREGANSREGEFRING